MTTTARATRPPADTVFFNGRIVTVDDAFSVVDALAVEGDRIRAVGTEAVQGARPHTRWVDLQGATVVPGLIDSHLHASVSGMVTGDVDLLEAESVDDVLAALSDRIAVTPPGQWVRSHPCWIEGRLRERRFPTPAELDRVSPDHPVYLRRTGFTYVLNSYAQRLLGITPDTHIGSGSAIVRDPDSGEALIFVGHVPGMKSREDVATSEDWVAAVLAITRRMNTFGVTGYSEPLVPPAAMGAYQRLWSEGRLSARVNLMLSQQVDGSHSMGVPGFFDEFGLASGFGDSRLRLGSIGQVGMRDGVPGALMREPYEWMDGGLHDFCGVATLADRPDGTTFAEGALRAAKANWRLALNACGDGMLDWALDLLESIDKEVPVEGRRHILCHPFLVHDDQLDRIKRLGLVVQSEIHAHLFTSNIRKYWGEERAKATFPTRTLFDADVVVGLGSDGPVLPENPFLGMGYFVTRETPFGIQNGDQALTRDQALRGYTINGAHLTCEEDVKGSLEAGKLADLVILSDDLLGCPDSTIKDITAVMTMVGGEIVHDTRDPRVAAGEARPTP